MITDKELEEEFWKAHYVVCMDAKAREDGRIIMLKAAIMVAKWAYNKGKIARLEE